MNDIDNLREACRGYPRAAIVSAIEAAIITHEQRTRGCRETATLIAVWLTDPGVAADPPPLSSALVNAIRRALHHHVH